VRSAALELGLAALNLPEALGRGERIGAGPVLRLWRRVHERSWSGMRKVAG
jgi:hypothetical protein